jgi:L-alanine-DL-glutamate epimerase-like enolase superfamily enzyme
LGERIDTPADIRRINTKVRENSFDLLQSHHTLSGIDIALWDLLGRARAEPAYRLLGYPRAYAKTAYASALFGDTPEATATKAMAIRTAGFRAAKFGWGVYGKAGVAADARHVEAARAGLGEDGILLIDAGTIFGDDVDAAAARLPALAAARVTWFEEPFNGGAYVAYRRLAAQAGAVALAAGEGCHDFYSAANLLDCAGLGFVQIDAGRIGGLSTAKQVADLAQAKGVRYVNHTFTSHLALAASLQPYAGIDGDQLCEYPFEAQPLARAIGTAQLAPDDNGAVHLAEAPGLGIEIDCTLLRPYLIDVEIQLGGRLLYRSPAL